MESLNSESRMEISDEFPINELFGSHDGNLRRIEEHFDVVAVQRENEIVVTGDRADVAKRALADMGNILSMGETLDEQKINYVISLCEEGKSYREIHTGKDFICFNHKGKPIKPKTLGQKSYVESIAKKDIVFGIGPAGTGKTYIAVAMAVKAYKNKGIEKIVLARPAVEAGERLGFLPGDLQEKVDPYLRPLYDALYDILGREAALRLKEKEAIEVVPLAYMRGRTLENSFIILDEAQNTTKEQMKMFLTRLGLGSKAVITGDITQIDLPRGKKSGLIDAIRVLKPVNDIDFSYLKDMDVVRHQLVKKIIRAYDEYYKRNPEIDEEIEG